MLRFRLIGLFLVAIFLANPSIAQNVGEPAPDFTFKDLNEVDVSLSDFAEKVVGLYLFGHACPFCISAAPTLHTEVYDVFKSDPNFVLLGLDTWDGSAQQVDLFRQSTGALYPLLQKAGSYESSVGSTYDRFLVVGSDGNLFFKGTARIASQMSAIKQAVGDALAIMPTSNEEDIPGSIRLYQNYPNPFNPSTQVKFDLDRSRNVSLEVYSALGKKVASLVEGARGAGSHVVEFDAKGLPSGQYVLRMQAGDKLSFRLMTLSR